MLQVDVQSAVDGLERSRFTRYLLEVLLEIDAGQGVVVGLEGEWGSGKTWVLRQLQTLDVPDAHKPRLVFLRFNPWMVSGARDLVAALLEQLSKQLAEHKRVADNGSSGRIGTAVKAIDKYAAALIAVKHAALTLDLAVPGLGTVVGGVAAAAEKVGEVTRAVLPALPEAGSAKSLPTLRDDISAALKDLQQKIVVVVDDLDRIPPAEVAAMVQTIKAVADFPNVVYLLAYEPGGPARALERALEVEDGRAYLEKIVQLPVPLPQLPARRHLPFVVKKLRDVLPQGWEALPEKDDIEPALKICAGLLTSPRDTARLCTRLAIVLRALQGEVNLADVIVAEALVLKVANWLPWMRSKGHHFINAGLAELDETQVAVGMHHPARMGIGLPESLRRENEENLRSELFGLHGDDQAAHVYRQALRFVFYRLKRDQDDRERRINSKRMSQHRYWYRWLCLTDQQEPLSMQDLLLAARDPNVARDNGWLDTVESIETLFMHFGDVFSGLGENNLGEVNALSWADALIRAENSLGPFLLRREGLVLGTVRPVHRLLASDNDMSRRQNALAMFLERGSLDVGATFLVRALSDQVNLRPLADKAWLQEKALTWLQRLEIEMPQWCETGVGPCGSSPLTLLNDISDRALSKQRTHEAALHVLSLPTSRLAHFFGNVWAGSAEQHHFGLSIPWHLLPMPADLVQRIEDRERDFKNSHPAVWALIKNEAETEGRSEAWKAGMFGVTSRDSPREN
jgi:KAP family P-loop domain